MKNNRLIDITVRLHLIRHSIGSAFYTAFFLLSISTTAYAAIEVSGDVHPFDSTTWTSGSNIAVGSLPSSSGTVVINDKAEIQTLRVSLGNDVSSTGTITVTDSGSKWTMNDVLSIGNKGNGSLIIQAGWQVVSRGTLVGNNSGSTGMVTVKNSGSIWPERDSIFLGGMGNGTLTASDGGMVVVNRTLYTSLSNLSGNGTISTNGVVLDTDLLFDENHGPQKAFDFGTNGTLNLNQNKNGDLGVGYQGSADLKIDKIEVASAAGFLGYLPDSHGTATVTGAGAKWNMHGALSIGVLGNGALDIQEGAEDDAAAVAAVGPAAFDVFFAPKADEPVAAFARLDLNFHFVQKQHGNFLAGG
jgi:T5SS/PEP-CTERM-associated repeat protein